MAKKWEYLLLKEEELQPDLLKQKLDELGNQGWEFVSVTAIFISTPFHYFSNQYLFSLKRQKT